MRQERRTRWYEWRCDLEACDAIATTHPALFESDPPVGWVTLYPPKFWKGSALAFCSPAHAEQFGRAALLPMLTPGGGS